MRTAIRLHTAEPKLDSPVYLGIEIGDGDPHHKPGLVLVLREIGPYCVMKSELAWNLTISATDIRAHGPTLYIERDDDNVSLSNAASVAAVVGLLMADPEEILTPVRFGLQYVEAQNWPVWKPSTCEAVILRFQRVALGWGRRIEGRA